MANPDISQLTADQFLKYGGKVFAKKVLNWNLRELGIQVRVNVKEPQSLTKLSAVGNPRPYSAGDNTAGNGVKFTDRVLTAYLAKWDHDFDPEEFRNTYLANATSDEQAPFYQEATEQLGKEFLEAIYLNTLYLGVRNGAGTTAAAICNGWGTIIAAEITATNLEAVATGALTNANAVTKVEQLYDAADAWMKKEPTLIYCSRNNFMNYARHYRTLNTFKADLVSPNQIKIDNTNCLLTAADFMGTSGRLIHTVPENLVFGTDVERIKVAASVRRNIIEARPMMSAGCEIQDLDAINVNDVA